MTFEVPTNGPAAAPPTAGEPRVTLRERLIARAPLLARVVGYPLFFMFWFVLFVYVTFPYDRVKELIIAQVEAPRQTPSGSLQPSNMQVSIDELGPTILPGVRARGVALTLLPTKAGERPSTVRMSEVTAHVGILSLLASNLNADVDIDGMGGTTRAHIESAMSGRRAGLREFRMKMDNVRLAELPPIAAMVGLPVTGSLDADVTFHVPDGRLEQSSGSVQLSVEDLRVGDGHAQYQIPPMGGVTIEQIRAGNLAGQIAIRDGVATIERMSTRSNEFSFAMDGRVELRPNLGDSAFNAGVRFQLTDAYRRKSEQAGRIMMVMDMVPDLQSARRADGMIGFRCNGTFDRGLRCLPDSRGGAGRGAGGAFGGFGGAGGAPARRGFE